MKNVMPHKPSPATPVPSMVELLESSQPSDWRPLAAENTLYLELASGRVVIELAPDFAPSHVANIHALAREKYWDGLAATRVNDNYVVQFADPHAEDPAKRRAIKQAKETLPAEFERSIDPQMPFTALPGGDGYAGSVGFTHGFPVARDERAGRTWLVHTYGTVSAGRDVNIDSGNGSELTVVIGHAPRQLDRNVTAVGRVRQGIELISSLPRGYGNLGFYQEDDPAMRIKSVRLASQVPVAEQTPLEVLRTDTPLFLQLIESRRNRREAWFHRPAEHVEIGNVPLPVRPARGRLKRGVLVGVLLGGKVGGA